MSHQSVQCITPLCGWLAFHFLSFILNGSPLYSTASCQCVLFLPGFVPFSLWPTNWLSKLFLHLQAKPLGTPVLPISLAFQGSQSSLPILLGCQEAACGTCAYEKAIHCSTTYVVGHFGAHAPFVLPSFGGVRLYHRACGHMKNLFTSTQPSVQGGIIITVS